MSTPRRAGLFGRLAVRWYLDLVCTGKNATPATRRDATRRDVTYDDDDDPALFLRGEEMRSLISTNRAVFALLHPFATSALL